MLVRWNKELLEVQREVNIELEKARYQRATLKASSPDSPQWEKIIKLREKVATEKLQQTNSLMEKVGVLREQPVFDAWIERFMQPDWTSVLSDSERRTFCFFVI